MIDFLRRHPDRWDQRHFEQPLTGCRCLAGWSQALYWQDRLQAPEPDSHVVKHQLRKEGAIMAAVRVKQFLQITGRVADWLLHPSRGLEDFDRLLAFLERRPSGRTADGRDFLGFDVDGYGPDGFNVRGFDRLGRDAHGCNWLTYDRRGNDLWNPPEPGRMGSDGLDSGGFDSRGFDEAGRDYEGRDYQGLDSDGFDCAGRDAEGYDRQGFDEDDVSRDFKWKGEA